MLHPRADDYERAGPKPNTMSCVLASSTRRAAALLLTGDIEAEQEARLVARARRRCAAEVLLVPHHGSKTSSTAAFLDAVAPRVAVVQAGYRNRFGHPAPAVLARYDERGIAVVRSDGCGAWQWPPAAEGAASCERARDARYWHWRPARCT